MHNRLTLFLVLAFSAAASLEAGEIRGRLMLAEKPAAGVTVSAIPYETPFEEARREARRQPAPKPLASAQSAKDGAFSLSVAADPAGRGFRVRFEGGGAVPILTAGVYDAGESADLGDEPLARASRLAGRVVDPHGRPLAGAEVTLVAGGGLGPLQAAGDTLSVPRVSLTGADGSFRFEDARPQGNQLKVEARGLATVEVENARDGAMPRPIAMQPGLSLSGSVVALGRKAAAGTLVRFLGKATSRWVESGPDGSFRLADLPAGGGALLADGGEQGLAEVRGLRLPESASQKLQVVLATPAAIEGRVVDARSGAPVARAKVLARAGERQALARSGTDGRYRLAGLLPQRYRVEADDSRYVPYARDRVVLLAGAVEKVDLPLTLAAAIRGRVVDEDGAPVAGARGQVAHGGETGMRAFLREQRAGARSAFQTAADGSFRATRLMPGDNQRLTVSHPEFEARTLGGLSLPPGGTRSGVSVVLGRGLSLTGIIKDTEGKPIAGADVLLNQAVGFRGGRGGMLAQVNFVPGPEGRPRTTSGADGRFEFKGLGKGDYVLIARMAGLADAVLDPAKVAEGAEPVELVLRAGATISGLVTDSTGQPAQGYFVQLRPRGGDASPMRGGGPRNATGRDGFFSIDGLQAGETYDLIVMGPDGPGPRREGVSAPAEGLELIVAGKGRIAGRVVDAANGQAVSDFEISFNPDRSGRGAGMVVRMLGPGGGRRGAGEKEQVHSEDGSFVLDDVPSGAFEVNVDAKSYQAGRVSGLQVDAGQTKDGVVVKLSRGSGIRGRVTDASSGRGVPDARVTTEVSGGQARMPMLDLLNGGGGIPTDADGLFEIDGLAQGRYLVNAEHPDYSETSLLVEVKEGVAATELRLSGGSALSGLVISETRRPLASAQVTLEAAGEGGSFGRRGPFGGGQGAVTDVQGRFKFDHLTAGRYRVVAALRERSSPPVDVAIQASETKDGIELQIQAGATLRGMVTGLPAASRGTVNVNASGPESYFAATRAGSDGAFELDGVPAGRIALRATAGDFLSGQRSASKSVTVPEGQTLVRAEIEFESGFAVTGSVTRAGQPVPDAFVSANARGGGGNSASSRTDASGAYRLEGLQQGSYSVNVNVLAAGGGSRSEQLQVDGDTTLDIKIPVARIAGTVVEATSKQPLADAVVQADSGEQGGPRMMRASTTDSNGRFALEDLDEKAYTLTSRRAGFQFDKRQLTAAEQGSDEVVIELLRGEGIGVQARDGIFGVPLRGLTARVLDAGGASVFMGNVSLDSEGRGEIPSIKPGAYSLMLDASGYAPVGLAVSVPAPPVAVAMTPGGNVEIRAGEATLAKGQVTLQFLDGAGRPYPFSIFNPSGRLVLSTPSRLIENFAPGRYTLDVAGGKPQPIAVAEGQTTVVSLP